MYYSQYGLLNQPVQNAPNNTLSLIRVNGVTGAYQCQLPPNTESILVSDAEKPIVYLITVNGLNRTVTAYDIAVHKDQQQLNATSNNSNLEQTLTSISDRLQKLEGDINELKSNTGNTRGQQNSKYNKSGNGSNAGSN